MSLSVEPVARPNAPSLISPPTSPQPIQAALNVLRAPRPMRPVVIRAGDVYSKEELAAMVAVERLDLDGFKKLSPSALLSIREEVKQLLKCYEECESHVLGDGVFKCNPILAFQICEINVTSKISVYFKNFLVGKSWQDSELSKLKQARSVQAFFGLLAIQALKHVDIELFRHIPLIYTQPLTSTISSRKMIYKEMTDHVILK